MRRNLFAMIALLLVAASPAPPEAWTRAWTSSLWRWNGPADAAVVVEDATIRSTVRVGAGGPAIRLRLGNDYGDAAVRIGGATVTGADGRTVRVTFAGVATTRLWPGAQIVSDSVALPVKAFETVTIALYLPERTIFQTVHGAGGAPTAVSATGDHSGTPGFAAARTVRERPMIAGIDVATPRPQPVVVAYGDSITDNTWCQNDSAIVCRWGDVLGRRLAKAGKPHVVVTQAIGGNRVLNSGTGPSALARFDRDVLAVPGVSHVVLLEGINDIGAAGPDNPITADDLIAAFRQLIARAHDKGIKVYASPILPWKGATRFTPEREAIRVAVNRWIRTSGAFDGVVDLEKPVADPADPLRLATPLQGRDNLHPNAAGEMAMGEAIPLGLFR